MAKSSDNRKGRRQTMPPRTIDLELNKASQEMVPDADVVAEETMEVDEVTAEMDKTEKMVQQNDAGDNANEAESVKAPNKRGTSVFALLTSGLVGGVVALGGAQFLNMNGSSTNSAAGTFEQTQAQIAQMQEQINGLSKVEASNRIDPAVITRLESLENAAGTGSNAVLDEAKAIAMQAKELAEQSASQISDLSQKILSSAVGTNVDESTIKAAIEAETSRLSSKIDALESAAKNVAVPAELEARLAEIGPLSEKTNALETNLGGLATKLGSLEDTINTKIVPSMKNIEQAGAAAVEGQKVARAVSARSLDAALSEGDIFASELASARILLGDTDSISKLKALSDSGLATRDELVAGFANVSEAIFAASMPQENAGDDGVFTKLMESAKSLVSVRPAGPIPGDAPVAIVSRIEAKLKSGEIDGALSEWQALPQAGKDASSDWMTTATKRLEAETLVKMIIDELGAEPAKQG